MRKIKANFFISLDGVSSLRTSGTEEWAAYWPEHADEPFGDVLNSAKKYVVSNTLTSAEWENSEILSGDAAAKVAGLKSEDGGDLVMSGSATTVRWLLGEGLLDELHLFVHPVVVGDGMARLLPADAPQTPLELISSKQFETGVVYLTYGPAR